MYIKFLNNSVIFEDCTLRKLKEGVIKLLLKDNPEEPYAGFNAYLDKSCTILVGNYETYRTKYKDSGESKVLFLSTGEIYEEPLEEEIQKPTPEEIAAQKQQRNIEELQSQIAAYKAQIDATDYRIVKAYEYSMVGLESEYDMKALHEERQSFRDAINTLEEKMKTLMEG